MDGILIVNKPKGCTSHDVVAKIKKICKTKVGHTGTLDPMATGVLPILLGEGTKLSQYLINHNKVYEATMELGIKTDTADSEGKIIEKKEVDEQNLTQEVIQNILQSFVGKQKQTPPMYSAIKVNGKKLYEYARNNQTVQIPEREIEIYQMDLIKIVEKTILFRVYCSKGTYIRTLCEEIAQKLQTVGYMKELNRLQVGNFTINQAISLQELEKNQNEYQKYVITLPKFFEAYPTIALNENKLKLFLNGVALQQSQKEGIYQIKNSKEQWIGIGKIENNQLKRKIVPI